jgi:O-methyltransferase
VSIIDWPFDKWLDNVSLAALSNRETVQASYDIARLAIERGVPGDFVECGVFGGAQCAAMARAIMEPAHYWNENRDMAIGSGGAWPPRRVHLFDSFDGIPAPGVHDTDIEPGMHEAFALQSRCTLEDCKNHFREWGIPDELLVWHPGPFNQTVERAAVHSQQERADHVCKIAVLRLDGDLYESTKVCMEHLYPLLSPGGWCIIDDMGLVGARKAVDEYMKNASRPTYWQKAK